MTCAPSHIEKHAGGRPRTVSLPPDEMILLGKEMVTWVIENQPIHLSKWWSIHKDIPDDDWDTMRKIPEFFQYYAKAMRIIGYQYIEKDSKIDHKIKDRWLRVYFKDLRAQEDEDAKNASMLKKEEVAAASDIDSNALSEMTQLFSELQASSRERKSAEIKSNAETRS